MHRLVIVMAVLAITNIVPTVNAEARNMTAYKHYSRAQFVNMCARACKRGGGGTPAFCCMCNGGIWTGKFCT